MGQEIRLTILMTCLSFLILSAGFILFIHFFNRSKQKALEEKQSRELEFLQQIQDTETEIQNETLNAVARELHDNVGQVLTVAKIHIAGMQKVIEDSRLRESEDLIVQAVSEIRSLAKSLHAERISDIGLQAALLVEAERIERIQGITCSLNTEGDLSLVGPEIGIVLFRIAQEFIANSLKHAAATEIGIALSIANQRLELLLTDNGRGFDTKQQYNGNGLRNMRDRARLIGASFILDSSSGTGTRVQSTLTLEHE